MSPNYDFRGMSGFEPTELAVTSERATNLDHHASSLSQKYLLIVSGRIVARWLS